jgi:acetyltransferase-like isoleucine patch superfamily enzyme
VLRGMLRGLRNHVAIRRDAVAFARSLGVSVGERCRLTINAGTFGSEPYLVRLGDHVTVTAGVRFITHDGGVWVFREQHPDIDVVAPISVGNNVFIGVNSIILAGVTIGDDCVVGAGSVVTRDIPAGSVAAGVPARVLRSRDEYWRSTAAKALYIRGMDAAEKRAYLIEHLLHARDG